MADEDALKLQKRGFYPEKQDPALNIDTIEWYLAMLQEVEPEKKQADIWETKLRFEDSEKVYGARFIAMLYDRMVEFKIVAVDFAKITYSEFAEYLKQLISKMKSANITAIV